jgi:HAD superfamily hydrolase (TIGR01484 family)
MSGMDSTSRRKKIIIFDLDGTLTKSKSDLDQEMGSLICELLRLRYVAVTSGCSFQQFENQFLSGLPKSSNLSNLFLFPTCSASGYYYDRKRRRFSQAYTNLLSLDDLKKIRESFRRVFAKIAYFQPAKTFGAVFENRGSQLTFSALGQRAPLRFKRKWDPNQQNRLRIRRLLRMQLPKFEISIGGTTSIDVTRKGVDKTLCVKKLRERLGVTRKDMLFVGDALFKGGNDYIMKSTRIRCISVSGPKETKELIRRIIHTAKVAPLPDGG